MKANGYSPPAELLDQERPHNAHSELMILRALVLSPHLIDLWNITGDHFYVPAHQKIFLALAQLREDNRPGDIAHLDEQLRDNGHLDEIGGRPKLAEMLAGEPLPSRNEDYLAEVRDAYALRGCLDLGMAAIQAAHSGRSASEVLGRLRARLDDVAAEADGQSRTAPAKPVSAKSLIAENPPLHEPIIAGILRREETANVIAAPKMGKSWLSYGLGLSVVTETKWLGQFQCRRGNVLLIDNELHEATLASRLQTVAVAMGLSVDDYGESLTILSLRGRLANLHGISDELSTIEPGTYDLVILDAFYRALPAGASENDNATIAGLYNVIDATAKRLQCSWVNIHHSSKGGQAEKAVTDVGSGAGSQSRAADAHLVLRPHEEDGAVVLEAVVRSFAPVEPVSLRWDFPLWVPDDTLDPAQLRGRLTKGEERQLDRTTEGKAKILDALAEGAKTVRALRGRVDMGRDRCNRLLDALEADGSIDSEEVKGVGGKQRRYFLVNGAA